MSNLTSPLHLRPHHLLCLQTFVGHGYSEEFTAHMTLVKRQLASDPGTPIRLVSGADDLCAHCPNCVSGSCTSAKPALFDRLAAEQLMLMNSDYRQPPKDDCSTAVLLEGIPENLKISTDLIEKCCLDCEWRGLCKNVISS